MRAAIGYEGQALRSVSGLITGTWAAPVRAITPEVRRTVNSGYAELYVPLFSAENARPGLHELVVDLAVRSDHYSDLEEDSTVNPKYGIDWAPIENLKFRATYGESFRAPTFAQIYGNSSALFVQNYSDPTRGGAITQGVTLSGGNLALEPETASTYTFGVDYVAAQDLRLNLTLLPHRVREADHFVSFRPHHPESRKPVRGHGHHRPQSRSCLYRRAGGDQAHPWSPAESRHALRRWPDQQSRHDDRIGLSTSWVAMHSSRGSREIRDRAQRHILRHLRGGDHACCRSHRSTQHHLQPAALQGSGKRHLEQRRHPGRVYSSTI